MGGADVRDVVVVGAGAIGASCAYHLAARGRRVTVVEMFAGPAQGSSGRSFASVRAQWGDALNIEISWRSIQKYARFVEDHGIDVGYRPTGYLLLFQEEAWGAQLEAVELQRRHGVPVEVLDVAAAARITPFAPDGLAGATFGTADGVVDPHAIATGYLAMARERGADVLFKHRVTAIQPGPGADGWVVTAGERQLTAGHVVNAAGGWGADLAALAGLDVPVVHLRRNVYSMAPGAVDRHFPLTIDTATKFFLRSDGPRLLFGGIKPDEVPGYRVDVDWPWMESLLEIAETRFPWMVDLPIDPTGAWAGTYEVTPDHLPVLGADPAAPTWVNACGFSGHGIMQAPEIGRMVAEQVVDGCITSLDVSPLRLDRFTDAASHDHTRLVF